MNDRLCGADGGTRIRGVVIWKHADPMPGGWTRCRCSLSRGKPVATWIRKALARVEAATHGAWICLVRPSSTPPTRLHPATHDHHTSDDVWSVDLLQSLPTESMPSSGTVRCRPLPAIDPRGW